MDINTSPEVVRKLHAFLCFMIIFSSMNLLYAQKSNTYSMNPGITVSADNIMSKIHKNIGDYLSSRLPSLFSKLS